MNIDELMRKIQDEVAQRRYREEATSFGASSEAGAAVKALWKPITPRVAIKQAYKLGELLDFDDLDFVDTAYRVLLRRPPDSVGLTSCLNDLRNGTRNKILVLGDIRFSEEGMSRGVHVDGLLLPYKLQQWSRKRFIGRPIAWLQALIRLETLPRRLDRQGAIHAHEIQSLGRCVNGLADSFSGQLNQQRADAEAQQQANHAVMETALQERDEQIGQIRFKLAEVAAELQVVSARESHILDLERAELSLAEELKAVQEKLALSRQVMDNLEVRLAEQHREFERQRSLSTRSLLEMKYQFQRQASSNGSTVEGGAAVASPSSVSSSHDALYACFEDDFRGTREDIKARARYYLPFVEGAVSASLAGPVIDLGCGRGEWLELLGEHGIEAKGVDLNKVMLHDCMDRGFNVIEQDAVTYLRSLEADSVSAITSMHLVEHLPFDSLMDLLDEAFRVLRVGGVLILETPNPENLLMSTQWFYMDPTYRNPLPPPLLSWLVKARGFADISQERLFEKRGIVDMPDAPSEAPGAQQVNQLLALLRAAPDYAVVAYKR